MSTLARFEQSATCHPAAPETVSTTAQQQALAGLPLYDVEVTRRSSHKRIEENEHGIFWQESVRYSDDAVRLATIGIPHEPISRYPIVAADAWYTGPNGFNSFEIKQAMAAGFPIIWNHHQGRHAIAPTSRQHINTIAHSLTSKSIGKSAAQDHALLKSLDGERSLQTDRVIRKGYSRGAMTGEAFIALSQLPSIDRQVIWSDLEGACFARKVGYLSMMTNLAKQIPAELLTLAEITLDETAKPNLPDGPYLSLRELLGTTDLNLINQAHELAWCRLLICGDAGKYAEAIAINAVGVRTVYQSDLAGQQADWRRIHAPRKGIEVLTEPGGHLAGATWRMLFKKQTRLRNLASYLLEHDNDVSQLRPIDVLEP